MTRLTGALRLEARVQLRNGLWAVAAFLTALMTALVLLAEPAAAVLGPLILVIDTASFGVLFVAVLILFERTEGAFDALTVSPLRPGEYLAVKVGPLTAVAVASAVPIALAAARGTGAGAGGLLLAVTGVGLLAVLMLTWSAAMALPYRSLIDFVSKGFWLLVPLLLAPIPHVLDLWTHPLLYLVPSTGAADLVRAGIVPGAMPGPWKAAGVVAYLLAATAGGMALARRRWSAGDPSARSGAPPPGSTAFGLRRGGRAATLVRLDVMTVNRDPMLVLILLGPMLVALCLRFGYPPFERFALDTWDLALEPHRPLVAVALVVLHVPYMIGSLTALLIAEDLDERHLLALRASPLSTAGYLAYRLGTAAVLSFALLAASTSIVGTTLLTWSIPLTGALALAALTGPLAALLVVAFTSGRVEALSALKLVNLLPVGIPAAAWFLDEPFGLFLAPLPYFWVGEATWVAGEPGASYAVAMAAGLLTTLAVGLLLGRRAVGRLSRA